MRAYLSRFVLFGGFIMEIIQNIAVAIDNLRISKGLTVSELCLDICDESSYRRYKSGNRDIPIAKIKQFCDKLGIGLDEFLYNVSVKNSYEYKKIHKMFLDLQSKKYDEIRKSLPLIKVDDIGIDRNKVLFKFILYTYQYETKKITSSNYYELLLKLLPEQSGFYTFNDLIIFEKLALLEVNQNESPSLKILLDILLNTEKLYVTNTNQYVLATTYANVANYLTKRKEYEEALKICNKGLEYSKSFYVTKNIHYLYYLKAYCLFHTEDKEGATFNLSIVISWVFAIQDEYMSNYFINLIMKEFNMTKSMIYQMHQKVLANYL